MQIFESATAKISGFMFKFSERKYLCAKFNIKVYFHELEQARKNEEDTRMLKNF